MMIIVVVLWCCGVKGWQSGFWFGGGSLLVRSTPLEFRRGTTRSVRRKRLRARWVALRPEGVGLWWPRGLAGGRREGVGLWWPRGLAGGRRGGARLRWPRGLAGGRPGGVGRCWPRGSAGARREGARMCGPWGLGRGRSGGARVCALPRSPVRGRLGGARLLARGPRNGVPPARRHRYLFLPLPGGARTGSIAAGSRKVLSRNAYIGG